MQITERALKCMLWNSVILQAYGSDKAGSRPGELSEPRQLQRMANGSILVADTGNNRIVQLDANMQFVREIPLPFDGFSRRPLSFYLDEVFCKLWVSDKNNLLLYDVWHLMPTINNLNWSRFNEPEPEVVCIEL